MRIWPLVCWSMAMGAACTGTSQADITLQQKSSLDVVSMIRMHGAITTSVTADKRREDSESHCEGMMSIVCGNLQNGEIVRLDRNLTWNLQPGKKRYREQVFATPEELAALRAKLQANLEKMRSCPVSQKQQPIDKSKCEMSPPRIDVHKTGDKLSIAGHDAQRTSASLTETCTNKDTGDVCDTVVAVDVWLTQDALPGSSERRAFDAAYAKKLGLDDAQGFMRGEAAKFLGPYQAQIKQLTDKSAEFKGVPLKTSLRVLMGGQQCSATAKTQAGAAPGGGSGGANPMADIAQAGNVIGSSVGHVVGGLFHKRKPDDTPVAASAAAPADAGPEAAAPDAFAQYTQLAAFSLETVTISADPVPAERFEIPADWTKEASKTGKTDIDDYTCPKT